MNKPRTKLCLLAIATTALAVPPVAAAEYLVPPGNSAVTQYTESFPTAGGDKNSEKAGEKSPTPAQALGERNAKRLEAQGEDGQVVAEVAAATAPSTEVVTSPPPAPAPEVEKQTKFKKHSRPTQTDSGNEADAVVVGSAGSSGDGGGPSGSSGFSEVLAQATGASSGQMGLLLPLAILGTLAWALAFLWRQRNRSMA